MTPVLPRVVVMCVVTVTWVVDSSDEVFEVKEVVDVLVSVQVSMLVVAEPLAASAVAVADSSVRVEIELVSVEVSVEGEQDTWSQIVVMIAEVIVDVQIGVTVMPTLAPEVTQMEALPVTVPVEIMVVSVSFDGMLTVGPTSLVVVLVVGKGATETLNDGRAVGVVQLSVVV